VARATLDFGRRKHIREVVSLERSFVFDSELVLSFLKQPAPVFGHRFKDREGNEVDVVADILTLASRRGRPVLKLIHIKDYTPYQSYEQWKDELISMVAHEIKNPLAAMKNSMSVLISQANEGMTDGQRGLLNVSVRSIDRLTRLLDNVLDVSRISSGSYTPEPGWIDAEEFTSEVLGTFKTLFNVRRQRLEHKVSGEVGRIYVDAPKLEQILINLLNNAIKFTPDGGRVTVSVEPSGLEALGDDLRIQPWNEIAALKFVRFVVKDSGIGMTEDTLAHLFTRHYKRDAGGVKGSHLGLSISKALVEVQNGKLDFRSELGVGTEAAVSIPADEGTFAILGRLKSIERVLSRVMSLGGAAAFFVLRKDDSRPWGDVLRGCPASPRVNPAIGEEQTGNLFAWALSERLAVCLVVDERDPPSIKDIFGAVRTASRDHAEHRNGYGIDRHPVSTGVTNVATLVGLALKPARHTGGVRRGRRKVEKAIR
jgi:signal transduction histidine kinase